MDVQVTFPKNLQPRIPKRPSMVFDCFTFFNELDLLEIRLRELSNAVDYFVLSEARETHRGQKKELFFEENKQRFEPFLDRIIHVVSDNMADAGQYHPHKVRRGDAVWTREGAQRNAIAAGLTQASSNDWILVSDLDEIPRARIVDRIAKDTAYRRCVAIFEQDFYANRLNWRRTSKLLWCGTRMVEKRFMRSPHGMRRFKAGASPRALVPWLDWRAQCCYDLRSLVFPQRIPDGGWHFTSVGDTDHVYKKLTSYAHWDKDLDHDHYERDKIAARLAAGKAYNGGDVVVVPLSLLPECVSRYQDRYREILDLETPAWEDWLPAGVINYAQNDGQ